jgi:protein-L-isoaspartate(D-aspartate) O-methyltransferase
VIAQAGGGPELAIIADVPGVGWRYVAGDDGSFSMLLDEPGHPDGSWAACGYEPGADEYVVTEYGDRRLWAEMSAAYLRYPRRGGRAWCDTG